MVDKNLVVLLHMKNRFDRSPTPLAEIQLQTMTEPPPYILISTKYFTLEFITHQCSSCVVLHTLAFSPFFLP